MKRQIRQDGRPSLTVVGDGPPPPPPDDRRSAQQIALEDGNFGPVDAVVEQYLAELRIGKSHRRARSRPPVKYCPACGHLAVGHGRLCMTVLADTPDRRGIPERCQCTFIQ